MFLHFLQAYLVSGTISTFKQPKGAFSHIPNVDTYNSEGGSSRQSQKVTGSFSVCFLSTLTAQGKNFTVMIDTGSSDTTLAHTSLNNFVGKTITYTIPSGQTQDHYATYGDTSWWYGYLTSLQVAATGTDIIANAPIILMTTQSTSPLYADGINMDGLIGLGFKALSSSTSYPYTILDAWYQSGTMSKNQVAFHGCPYDSSSSAYVDYGNDTPYTSCLPNGAAKVKLHGESYLNFQLLDVAISGKSVAMTSTTWKNGGYSILDSCTSVTYVPTTVWTSLKTAVTTSGGLTGTLTSSSTIMNSWFNQKVSLTSSQLGPTWSKLPTLSFTLTAATDVSYQNVTLTLGPKQYIQKLTNGQCKFSKKLISNVCFRCFHCWRWRRNEFHFRMVFLCIISYCIRSNQYVGFFPKRMRLRNWNRYLSFGGI